MWRLADLGNRVLLQVERLVQCPQTPYQAKLAALLTRDLLKDGIAASSGVQNAMMELRMISNQPLLSRLHVQVTPGTPLHHGMLPGVLQQPVQTQQVPACSVEDACL